MINYDDMLYLTAFAKLGTLSEVAEKYYISQPTITRCMKKIEDEFDVAIFERTKNSIRLNDNGMLAASEAELVIRQYEDMLRRVRTFDKENNTISIGTAAAVQLPDLIRRVSSASPSKTISTELKKPHELLEGIQKDVYQLIILPYKPENPQFVSIKIGNENLMFFLPKKHRFAKRKSLSMAEMDGENMLLFSEIGFWHDITIEKMPHSHFLLQNERYSFEELIVNSVLPCFTTNLVANNNNQLFENRVCVPITDPEVNVTYYLVCKKENKRDFRTLFTQI